MLVRCSFVSSILSLGANGSEEDHDMEVIMMMMWMTTMTHLVMHPEASFTLFHSLGV